MLATVIVHHPARDHLLDGLLEKLGEPVEVVVDPEPRRLDPWKNWVRALRHGQTLGSDHLLVLENDILPCRDFLASVRKAIEAKPDDFLRFYSPLENVVESRTYEEGMRQKYRWIPFVHWGGVQAVVIPVPWIEGFVEWGESFPVYGKFPDGRLAAWLWKKVHKPAWTTLPSLVEHTQPSLMGNSKHRATWFLGENESALGIAW